MVVQLEKDLHLKEDLLQRLQDQNNSQREFIAHLQDEVKAKTVENAQLV